MCGDKTTTTNKGMVENINSTDTKMVKSPNIMQRVKQTYYRPIKG